MTELFQDLAFAVRSLRRRPGFCGVAVLTLAVGVAAVVAVSSVLKAVLIQPLPYREPDRLVDIAHRTKEQGRFIVPRGDYHLMRERATLFEDIAVRGVGVQWITVNAEGESRRVRSLYVSHNYLSTLGAEPALGRLFLPRDADRLPGPDEEREPKPPAVVVTYGFWQRFLGGDSAAVGSLVEMELGWRAEVVGVLEPDFRLTHAPASRWETWTQAEVFLPYPAWTEEPPDYERPLARNALMLGRLQPGVTYRQAQDQLDAIAVQLREEIPPYGAAELEILSDPLHEHVVARSRPALLILGGAVFFLLLLVCANLANLILVQARARSTETAVRATLGCGRGRLLRGSILESLLLAGGGAAAGIVLGWVGVEALSRLRPPSVPLLERISLDPPVIAFSIAAALLTAVLAAIGPAVAHSFGELASALKDDGRETMGVGLRRFMQILVVQEVAMSVVLLAGALLMVRTLSALRDLDPGYDAQGALLFSVYPVPQAYHEQGPEGAMAFRQALAERIGAIPGVSAVGFGSMPPHSQRIWNGNYGPDEATLESEEFRADFRIVAGDYFKALGTRVLAGRSFDDAGTPGEQAIVVDEVLAQTTWPGLDPLGRTLVIGDRQWRGEVVGVVQSMAMGDLRQPRRAAVYLPESRAPWAGMMAVVRTDGEPERFLGSIRAVLEELDPTIVMYEEATLADLHDRSMSSTYFLLAIMGFFAWVAVIVAAVGLFGVLSYAVRRRTHEIGLRIALGADSRRVVRWVMGQSVHLTALGAGAGLVLALALGHFMASLVYGVSPRDPVSLTVVVLAVSAVALLSAFVPAHRATRIEPGAALRTF